MGRIVFILLLVVVIAFFVFEMYDKTVTAEEEDGLGRVLANQKVILEKLDVMDAKLSQLKMRIR